MIINEELLDKLDKKGTINKEELLATIDGYFSSANRSYEYRIISELINSGHLYKIDSSTYTTIKKQKFSYEINDNRIFRCVDGYGDYIVWDTNILNKWINHLLASNITFVEVDKDVMGIVFDSFKSKGFKNVLLNPNKNEFDKYFDNKMIIIRPLTKAYKEPKHKISIERLIIQIYSDKLLLSLYGDLEMKEMINEIFKNYFVNLDKLYHYARRKKIFNEFYSYLLDNIDRRFNY